MTTEPERDPAPQHLLPRRTLTLLMAPALVTAATLVGMMLSRWLEHGGVSLLYLVAVLLAAVGAGIATGVTAAALSFLAYNFFFIEPIYTLSVTNPHELLALAVFLLVAVLTGSIAGRMRDQTAAARRNAAALHSVHDMSLVLAGAQNLDHVTEALVRTCAEIVGGKAAVLLPRGEAVALGKIYPNGSELSAEDLRAAQRCFARGEISVPMAAGWPGSSFEFHPLSTGGKPIGVLGFKVGSDGRALPHELEPVIGAIVRTASIAIERTRLAEESAQARAAVEQERLRSALLASISHDLRTPLASIVGASSSLRQLGPRMSEADRQDLAATIEEEAQRLSQFVTNLLDMTRLEAGAIRLTEDWIDPADPIRAAVARARKLHPGAGITLDLPPDLPLVKGEATALEQIVANLLDNAVKHGRARTIAISAFVQRSRIRLTVTDDGRGIPASDIERVFEKFYRARHDDHGAPGTGLGLTICRAMIVAMGGTIHAESPARDGAGTRIVIELPGSPETAPASSTEPAGEMA